MQLPAELPTTETLVSVISIGTAFLQAAASLIKAIRKPRDRKRRR